MCVRDTPPRAAGTVVEVKGGQTARPAAESRLTFGLSSANRYRVRPLASTSTLPTAVCRSEIAEPARTFLWAPPLVVAVTATIATSTATRMRDVSRLRFIDVLLLSGRSAGILDASPCGA